MGIEGNFRQISPSLLEIAQQDLYVLNLYLHAKQTIETGGMQYLHTYPRNEGIHDDLDAILANEQWKLGRLDINSHWHAIHYLLTENSSWEDCNLPFVVARHENKNRLLINAVMGGTLIDGTQDDFIDFGPVRYLTSTETQLISEALLQISLLDFKERYKDAHALQPKIYRTVWWDCDWEDYWDIVQEISEYYKIAVEKGRGMLLYLGCFHGVDFTWESDLSS